MHPLFALVANRPHLLAEHAQGYSALLAAEVARVSAEWKRRALLNAAALAGLAVATVLAGMALMLWSVSPQISTAAAWALVAVPLAPALAALYCVVTGRESSQRQPFESLREQVQADLAMLREVAAA